MAKVEETLDTGRLGDIRKRLGKHLPSDWVLTTLGETFKWGSGGTPKRTDTRFYGGDIPWLIIGDLNDGLVTDSATTITEKGLKESSAKWVEPGSILLAMYGSIGKLGITGGRLTTNQAIAFTKPDPVDAKYLFYYLMHIRGDLASLGKGATQKNISQTVIKAFPFVLAPQDQQKRIVAEIEKQFSRLDEAVANLKRVKANLKRYKAVVLKAAVEGRLVETEASIARREGRSYETGEQLLQRILETRRSQWKGKGKYKEPAAPDTTDLPELPDGWVWATVEQMADVGTGATPLRSKREYYDGGKVPWVTSGALNEEFVLAAEEYITDIAVQETNAKLFPAHTLLVAMYGEGKTRGKVSELLIGAATNQACAAIVMEGLSAQIRGYTKLFFLKYYDDIRRLSSGGVQPNLNLSHIKATAVPLPPLAEQSRIIGEVERRLSLVREVKAQVDTNLKRADRLRQSILVSAFAGRIIGVSDGNTTTVCKGAALL